MASWSNQWSGLSVEGVLNWGPIYKNKVVLTKLEQQSLERHRDYVNTWTEGKFGPTAIQDLALYIKVFWIWGNHNKDAEYGISAAQFIGQSLMESLGVKSWSHPRSYVAIENFILDIFNVITFEQARLEQQQAQRCKPSSRQGWTTPTQHNPHFPERYGSGLSPRNATPQRRQWPTEGAGGNQWTSSGLKTEQPSPKFPDIGEWADFANQQGIDASKQTPRYVYGDGSYPPVACLEDVRRLQGLYQSF